MKLTFSKKYYYILAILLLLLGSGAFLYWKLEPSSHFRNIDIPVLATPDSPLQEDTPDPGDTEQHNQPKKITQTSFNVLILGTDARDQEASRTDVIMLAHVNIDKKLINLISIPRDTRVNIPNVGYTKINHAHILGELKGDGHTGTEATLQTVSNLCACSINYYVKTNFEGFEHFIDTIGGIDVYLDEPVKITYGHRTIPAGDNHLTGADALEFVRERKSLPGGDSGRQANQALVLKEILHKVIKPQNLKRLPTLIDQVREDILDTNLTDSDIISLAWLAKDIEDGQFQYAQLPGHSGKEYDPLVKTELYYWIPDAEEWTALSKKLIGE